MKKEIYEAIAGVVAILFSIILWFQWLDTGAYTMTNGINTAITWLIGVIILSIAATLIGFLGEYFKASLGMDVEIFDIYDVLGGTVTILFTLILWFTWLSNPLNFTTTSIINTSMLWIIIAIILRIGSILIDFLRTKFADYLPKLETVTAKLKK
jgi:hypothetical protein